MLLPGDPAPYFVIPSNVNPRFNFDTAAGRYVVLSFFGSSKHPFSKALLEDLDRRREVFDTTNQIFLGVSIDREDEQRLAYQQWAGIRFFWDFDLQVSRQYGVIPQDVSQQLHASYQPQTLVLDAALRVLAVVPFGGEPAAHLDEIIRFLERQPKLHESRVAAPVLIVPHVFEPALCRTLIAYYEKTGGEDSGFMRDVGGMTVGILDYSHKRRMDCEIEDQDLVRATQQRIKRRLVPAIRQAYQFHANRIERHIVACYDAAQQAHFRAHRDNTTLGTAHRRFAITINLNSPDYEGGEIWFPEFGPKLYKPPSGAAIVFSCSLLHEVPPVTQGKRYAFLPFLYDDAAAAVRERNRKHLGDLSGATGGKATNVCDNPTANSANGFSSSPIDGSPGCGNPDGCGTCLTAPTYQIEVPADRSADRA